LRPHSALCARTAVALALIVALAGCGDTQPKDGADEPNAVKGHPSTATVAAQPRVRVEKAGGGSAAAALETLPVKGRAPKTGYSREQYGNGWLSVNRCETRDRMLDRDLSAKQFLDDCRVQSGKLNDPYTAARITFERGGTSEVDIDHVVALSDSWQKGAQQWSHRRRVAFANDALNLLSVDASANRAKSDGDAATWLPSNKRFRCDYVARQVAVKTKYKAWVTQAEHDAIARVLSTCPGEPLPHSGRIRVRVVPTHTQTAPASAPTFAPKPRKRGSEQGQAYANCDAARAAGAAPIMRGTPDYDANPRLDRDDDGIACES
jgi:hypothetical protein